MKNTILFISAIVIFACLNVAIYQKEQIKQEGEVILLKVKPIDPRSLMQGNYMALHYAIEDDINKIDKSLLTKYKFAVIKADENGVAQFVRLYQGEKLAQNEKLIQYHYNPNQWLNIHLKPNSFFFQEDLQPLYQKAAYAIFQYRGNKDYLLVGMADKQGKEISLNESSQ